MKKVLLWGLIMALILIPCTGVKAGTGSNVIYVNGSAANGGNGRSARNAVRDLGTAYGLLGESGGTIIVCGNTTISEATTFPSKNGTVNIIGLSSNGVSPTISLAGSKKQLIDFSSPVCFSNIHFDAVNTAGCVEFFAGPSLCFGENMTFTYHGDAIDDYASGRIGVRLGRSNAYCAQSSFVMTSGRISYIHGGNNKYDVGDSSVTFGGNADVALYIQASGTNKNVGTSTVNIIGGTIPTLYLIGYGNVTLGSCDVTIIGGTIGSIDMNRTTGGSITGDLHLTVSGAQIGSTNLDRAKVGGSVTLDGIADESSKYEPTKFITVTGTTGGVQGTAMYGNYLVVYGSTGKCSLYNMASNTPTKPIATINSASANSGIAPNGTSDSRYTNHANQVMFGSAKFAETDPLPLIYILDGNSGEADETGYIARCRIERFVCTNGKWSTQLVQTIVYNDNGYECPFDAASSKFLYHDNADTGFINTNGYERVAWGWPAFFIDGAPTELTQNKLFIFGPRFRTTSAQETVNRNLYGISNYQTNSAYIITEFTMPALPSSESDFGQTVTLYPTDILHQFAAPFDIYVTQGGMMYGGKIYYSFGFGGHDAYTHNGIRVYDIATESISDRIDLLSGEAGSVEPECTFVKDGCLALSYQGGRMYVFNGYKLR